MGLASVKKKLFCHFREVAWHDRQRGFLKGRRPRKHGHAGAGNERPSYGVQGGGRKYAFFPFMGPRGLVPWRGVGAAPHKPSFSTATASLKSIMLTLAPHERVGGRGGDTVLRMILQHLRGREGLLILDEAQHLLLPR